MPSTFRWTIRAFRATDDPQACARFVQAHQAALSRHDVGKLDAASATWTTNASVVAVVVELNGNPTPVAGLRIHEPGGTQPLPFESAVSRVAPSLFRQLRPLMPKDSGEICALFRDDSQHTHSGFDLGHLMQELALVGLRVARRAGISTLWGIAPRHTVKFWHNMGYRAESRFGDATRFNYPDDRYPCEVVRHDLGTLRHVPEELRERLLCTKKPRTQLFQVAPDVSHHLEEAPAPLMARQ